MAAAFSAAWREQRTTGMAASPCPVTPRPWDLGHVQQAPGLRSFRLEGGVQLPNWAALWLRPLDVTVPR